jgi:hypothetical protein
MKLIPDRLSPADYHLIILAPAATRVPAVFQNVVNNRQRHASTLADMQKMRGGIYLKEGGVRPWQLTGDGRHCQTIDKDSWHLLTVDQEGKVCACVRYLEHNNSVQFQKLELRNSGLATNAEWGRRLKFAIEAEIAVARVKGISYAEVGGWALVDERRCTTEALRTALATYGLAQLLGGSLGVTTATVRNCSSSILRRIGGRPLEVGGSELPPYYDPQYECEMEILRFASYSMNPRYKGWIDQIRVGLLTVPVLCAGADWTETDLDYSEILAGVF